MTLEEIDKKISKLQNERRVLYLEHIKTFKQEAQKNVGRCFKYKDGNMAKVIGIPQEELRKKEIHINEYQYPAIYISLECTDEFPVRYDMIHSSAWGVGCMNLFSECEEISQEEFNNTLRMVFDKQYKKIVAIGSKEI